MQKKALLAVSFGTSYPEARAKAIAPIERALETAFPDREFRTAFTSRIIVRKLRESGESVEDEASALARLRAEGYDDIAVVPTHIIPGHEYGKLLKSAGDCAVSEPLLVSDEDLRDIARLLGRVASEEGRTLLVMGHGTDHAADEVYMRLRAMLPENVLLACAEGALGLESLLPRLDGLADKSVVLMPLMIVAGDHARNDLAGDGPDSWRSVLTSRGFDVRVRLQGLGELPEIRQKFVEKARRAAG